MSSDTNYSSRVTNRQVLAVYWEHIKRRPLPWIILVGFLVLAEGCRILIPIIDKRLIDSAYASLSIAGRPLGPLWAALVLIVAIRLVAWLFERIYEHGSLHDRVRRNHKAFL